MKLHLFPVLRKALLAAMAGAAVSSSFADTSYLAEGVNISNLAASTRFYDTGKGHYFSWDKYFWPELYRVYEQTGSFAFLGDLNKRIPSGSKNLNVTTLTNDSQTCWAQVSMNLVEYWHSYYGVFCDDSRDLTYGYTYDRQYLDETGGTLSLKQNLVFLDTFTNEGDSLWSYLDWIMLGDDDPYYATTKQKGKGGFWTSYYSTSYETRNWEYIGTSVADLQKPLMSQLGYVRESDGSYTLKTKGQLAYLSLNGVPSGGHGITCHGVELDSTGKLKALYVTNSDDLEYEVIKLYVDDKNGHVFLYTNEICTTLWEYSDDNWYIDGVGSIRTNEMLQELLAEYESNPLQWTGRKTSWSMDSSSKIGEALPDESTGWQVLAGVEYYPSYNFGDDRAVEFSDSASSGDVAVSGTARTAEMLLTNSELTYTFTGGQIEATELKATGGGRSIFKNTTLSGTSMNLTAGTVELGPSAQLKYDEGLVGSAASLSFNGGNATITSLTLRSGSTIDIAGNGSLTTTTLASSGNVTFLYSSADAKLTLSGTIKADAPITLRMTDEATLNQKYALISFKSDLSNWESVFQTDSGLLEYSGKTLYLTYVPYEQLFWGNENGTWAANQWVSSSRNTDNTMVIFNGTEGGNVSVKGTVQPHSITITEGNYVFSSADSSAAVNMKSGIILKDNASLQSNVSMSGDYLSLRDSAYISFNSNSSFDSINSAANSTLHVGNGATLTLGLVEIAAGQIQVDAVSSIIFNGNADASLSGRVTGNGQLVFDGGASYSLDYENTEFAGSVSIGAGSSLQTKNNVASCEYTLSDADSTLSLTGTGTFAGTVRGNGNLVVAEGATMTFLPETMEDGLTEVPFDSAVKLSVHGFARIGNSVESNGLVWNVRTQFADDVYVSGELYCCHENVYDYRSGESQGISMDSLHLDGGTFSNFMHLGSVRSTVDIQKLEVSAKGGVLYSGSNNGTTQYFISNLSGSGDLTLERSGMIGSQLYMLHSVDNKGYSGDITLTGNVAWGCPSWTDTFNMILMEVDDVELSGSISLTPVRKMTDDDGRSRIVFGLNGDATIGGLDSPDYGNLWVYSGKLKESPRALTTDAAADFSTLYDESAHTLTIDAAGDHAFYGKVYGSLSINKKGKGKQTFGGDMSSFNGAVDVQGGTLDIVQGFNASRTAISNASLSSIGTVSAGSSLAMTNATLSAERLTSSAGSFSGVNTISAGSITGGAWVLTLGESNVSAPVINLSAASALTLSSIQLVYDAEAMYVDTYKLLSYDSSLTLNSSLLAGLEGISVINETLDGKRVKTLVYFLADGEKLRPRKTPTELTWLPTSGAWELEKGHKNGSWSSNTNNSNFYNGDSVVFDKAATVSLSGELKPAAVTVNHTSGSLIFTGSGSIAGVTSISKSGAGTLVISQANSYTGGTQILDGSIQMGHAQALGSGEVALHQGKLDMGGHSVMNDIMVDGTASILNGADYKGTLKLQNASLSGEVALNSLIKVNDSTVSATLSGTGGIAASGKVTLSGNNSYKGGIKLDDAQLVVANSSALGTGQISSSGQSSIEVADGVTLTLKDSISNSGTLSLSGLFDVSKLSKSSLSQTHVSADGTAGNHGFIMQGGYSVQLVSGGSTVSNGASIFYQGTQLTLGGGGVASYFGTVDYSTYQMGRGENASLAEISAASGGAATDIALNNGTLTMDGSVTGALTLNGGTLLFSGTSVVVEDVLTIASGVTTICLDDNYQIGNTYTLLTAENIDGNIDRLKLTSQALRSEFNLYTSGNSLMVDVNRAGAELTWLGGKKSTWTTSGGLHWEGGSSAAIYEDGDHVTFDQAGTVTIAGTVSPGSITVRANRNITFKTTKKVPGAIAGSGDLTKNGAGTLTLNDGNDSWTGDTYLNAGTIKVKGASSFGQGCIYIRSGVLNLASKTVGNDIVQNGTAAVKSGKKYVGSYILESGELQKGSTINVAKTATLAGGTVNGSLSGAGSVEVIGKVMLGDKGKITTSRLSLAEDATLSTSAKGMSCAKTDISIGEDATLKLAGKLSANSLSMNEGSLTASAAKPISITLKGNATLNDASATVAGKLTAANLTLNDSSLKLYAAKPQNLTVKQNLTLSSGSSLSLNGKLSAGNLSLMDGSSLTLTGSKPQTLKVKGSLTLNSGSSIILDYDFVKGKTYKLLTFKSYSGTSDFCSIFGVDEDDCVFTNTGKAITMTLTGNWNPKASSAVSDISSAPAVEAAEVKANPVADALVQANWGQLEASRAFVNAIANRSMAVQLGRGERAVWASAIGGSSRHSSAHGHAGADTNISGGAFGLETQVGRVSLFGLALGNSWTRVSAHGFDTIKQDTTHLGIYGQTNWRKVSADWSAAYGRSESEVMGSDWNQKHLQLDGRVSYNHELSESTVLRGFGGMQYYASDSADVNGIDTGSLQNLRAEIGVGASHRVGKLSLYGEAAVHQDLVRHNPHVWMEGARFGGMNPGRTGLNFTVGASYELNDKWSLNASYTGEVVENANAHSANVGATYKF